MTKRKQPFRVGFADTTPKPSAWLHVVRFQHLAREKVEECLVLAKDEAHARVLVEYEARAKKFLWSECMILSVQRLPGENNSLHQFFGSLGSYYDAFIIAILGTKDEWLETKRQEALQKLPPKPPRLVYEAPAEFLAGSLPKRRKRARS